MTPRDHIQGWAITLALAAAMLAAFLVPPALAACAIGWPAGVVVLVVEVLALWGWEYRETH